MVASGAATGGSSSSSVLTPKQHISRDSISGTWRHSEALRLALRVIGSSGLGNACAGPSVVPAVLGPRGANSEVAAAPEAAELDTNITQQRHRQTLQAMQIAEETQQQQQQQQQQQEGLGQMAAPENAVTVTAANMLHTSWSSAGFVVHQVRQHYQTVQQLLQPQQQQVASVGDKPRWYHTHQASQAAELLLCALFTMIIFLVLGVVTVYAVLVRGVQLLLQGVVTGITVCSKKLRHGLQQRRALAAKHDHRRTIVQPLLAEPDNIGSSDSSSSSSCSMTGSSSSTSNTGSSMQVRPRSAAAAVSDTSSSEAAAAESAKLDLLWSQCTGVEQQQQQLQRTSGAVRAIIRSIEQQTMFDRSCKEGRQQQLQLGLPDQSQLQQDASEAEIIETSEAAAVLGSPSEKAAQITAEPASKVQLQPAALVPSTRLASYVVAAQQRAAAAIERGHIAAEAAALVVSAYLVRAAYAISCFLLWRWQLLAARGTQLGYKHGVVAAEHLCCRVLWIIGCLAAGSSLVDAPQRSPVRTRLITVVKKWSLTAIKAGQWGWAAGEGFVTKVTSELLRDASPVTQTAVWGLAGMVKRNVVETCGLCWQLLVALSQVYMAQQQQIVAAQQQQRQQ